MITSADAQRDQVYFAQECAQEMALVELGAVPVDDLEQFAARALKGAGWSASSAPTFAFDVADDDERSGWHEAHTRMIHLHPRLLSPWVVLHELAHWVDPRYGHGPRFCANYIGLVDAGLGPDAAVELLTAFEDEGVEVDHTWLPEDISSGARGSESWS